MLLFESHFSARVNGSPNVFSKPSQALSNGPLWKLFIYSIIIPENWDFLPVFQPMVVCCNLGFRCCSLAPSSRLVGMAVVDNAHKERGTEVPAASVVHFWNHGTKQGRHGVVVIQAMGTEERVWRDSLRSRMLVDTVGRSGGMILRRRIWGKRKEAGTGVKAALHLSEEAKSRGDWQLRLLRKAWMLLLLTTGPSLPGKKDRAILVLTATVPEGWSQCLLWGRIEIKCCFCRMIAVKYHIVFILNSWGCYGCLVFGILLLSNLKPYCVMWFKQVQDPRFPASVLHTTQDYSVRLLFRWFFSLSPVCILQPRNTPVKSREPLNIKSTVKKLDCCC